MGSFEGCCSVCYELKWIRVTCEECGCCICEDCREDHIIDENCEECHYDLEEEEKREDDDVLLQ